MAGDELEQGVLAMKVTGAGGVGQTGQAKGAQLVAPAAELTDWTDVEEAEGC